MGVFAFFSYSARSTEISSTHIEEKAIEEAQDSQSSELGDAVPQLSATEKPETSPSGAEHPALSALPSKEPQAIPKIVVSKPSKNDSGSDATAPASDDRIQVSFRRFSLRAFSFNRSHEDHKPVLSSVQEGRKKKYATTAFSKRAKPRFSSSSKRAKESALIVRSLIIGPAAASPQLTRANAKPQLNKLKSQLTKPKTANKVIAQLRALPISDELIDGHGSCGAAHLGRTQGPIHAVCLEYSDAEEDKRHFAPLKQASQEKDSMSFIGGSASIEQVTKMFREMNIVDLVNSPDLGLGQPAGGSGLLAGAVPTAETVMKGIEQITPQLMALGFATGRTIVPDHAGIYPPTDRMTILTYWWGLELVLPPPSLEYLADAQSIAGTVVNFLSALSLINNGVREILPFVRYIAQFIDYEFNTIKKQDKGRGVVCAATWIMPAAMVPRPWDFPDPPADKQPTTNGENHKPSLPASDAPSEPLPPPAGSPPPVVIPPSLPTFADSIVGAYADSVHFQTVASPAKANAR
ncbi:hypothetical protein D9615_002514 [Tricholomella constricta]|uniref:Uncharacterized protein n=1 Tax=Tricholomella constricta TaxID=117010 RepID=A0A8H5HM18_9AGAR|nr:hypothetical protein D9615_002514 [Tricholomella constricta]